MKKKITFMVKKKYIYIYIYIYNTKYQNKSCDGKFYLIIQKDINIREDKTMNKNKQ